MVARLAALALLASVMSFDLLAPHYRWMEFVLAGEKLQRCRTTFLSHIRRADNILLLGEGNGRFLPVCRKQFPEALLTCVDLSASMLAQARRRLTATGLSERGVCFVQANALSWAPAPRPAYDLIVTNFFLDCFTPEQLERVTKNVSAAATPQANWLLADFQVAPSGLRRFRSKMLLALMYAFFRAATQLPARRLTAPDPFLEQTGFVLQARSHSEWKLLRSDWWARAN